MIKKSKLIKVDKNPYTYSKCGLIERNGMIFSGHIDHYTHSSLDKGEILDTVSEIQNECGLEVFEYNTQTKSKIEILENFNLYEIFIVTRYSYISPYAPKFLKSERDDEILKMNSEIEELDNRNIGIFEVMKGKESYKNNMIENLRKNIKEIENDDNYKVVKMNQKRLTEYWVDVYFYDS